MPTLTRAIIEAAISGFEEQKRRIDEQIADLRAMLPGAAPDETLQLQKPKRTMSAAGRRAIAEAQRRRWAAVHGGETPAKSAKRGKKAKRQLSPEGRAAIVAALKRRWAAKKAE